MFEKYVEQILKIFNYVDSALIADEKGIIKYYYTCRGAETHLSSGDIIGKHITDVYFSLKDEESTILGVLKSGEPVLNRRHSFKTEEGIIIQAITNTLPIREDGKTIGVIDVSSYERETFLIAQEKIKKERDLYTIDDIVSVSPRMNELKDKIKKVAQTDSSVLIYGETGTGKELFAQAIHSSGNRKNKPFISQNCSAIPSTLLESILFGTVKGSFTGSEDKKGLLELADGGTLFLDEICSMEYQLQGKLLKAIEEKKFTRVGGSKPIYVDVKIISATNERVEESLRKNHIRPDLLFRLSVVRLNIPPLRQRMMDIVPLTRYYINYYNYAMHREIIDADENVYDLFSIYNWPGNVRELRAAIECAFNITSGAFIGLSDLPEYMVGKQDALDTDYNLNAGFSLKNMVDEYEKSIIMKMLSETNSKAEAAEKLMITKQVLNYKLKKYNIGGKNF